MEAEILLKATRVDGVYSDDPEKNPHAVLYQRLDYDTVRERRPDIVYCMANGFGSDGPNADKTAYDDVIQAASKASRMRFRAVMITSLTTIAGLMPLLLERSLQAQVLIPIAISICFGLLASTVLVLLVLSSFYVIFNDFGLTEAS